MSQQVKAQSAQMKVCGFQLTCAATPACPTSRELQDKARAINRRILDAERAGQVDITLGEGRCSAVA